MFIILLLYFYICVTFNFLIQGKEIHSHVEHDYNNINRINHSNVECLNSSYEADYRGTKSITQSGHTCQHWILDTPHKKSYLASNPLNFVDKNLQAAKNYCRNPDNGTRPWCYTTDPSIRFDFCDIPLCDTFAAKNKSSSTKLRQKIINANQSVNKNVYDNSNVECLNSVDGKDYRGTKSITQSGYTCQHWFLNTPHKKTYSSSNPLNFMEKNLKAAKNYCRNPDGESRPWCYTTDPSKRFDACDIPLCNTSAATENSNKQNVTRNNHNETKKVDENNSNDECSTSTSGIDYRGKKSTTQSGYTCQLWISDIPHKKNKVASDPQNFPDKNLIDAKNYCRNPNKEPRPWCYTNDPLKRQDFCDIPLCEDNKDECLNSEDGVEYRGTQSTTQSGYTCQHWSLDYPHKKNLMAASPQNFPEKNLTVAKNYCRNPDGEPRLWCYTTDPLKRQDFCEIPFCIKNYDECLNSEEGVEYRGTKSTTHLGYTCQQWISDTPHQKNYLATLPHNFPDKNLSAAKNYCRNPDGEPRPWCYTTDPTIRHDFCDIPMCNKSPDECLNSVSGVDYKGKKSTTNLGYTCQHWISDIPHKKNHMAKNPLNFPEKNLIAAKNYCRNPDGEPQPWCYTTDTYKRKDFCAIPLCAKSNSNKSNLECLHSENGVEYKGTKSTTSFGYTCQHWNSNTPHVKFELSSNPLNFPEKSLTNAKNYCRNPDNNLQPWCFTTDPSMRFDFCDIPMCV